MPRQTEPSANNALGGLHQDMMPRGEVRSENTQAITGQSGLRPDIVITAPGRLRHLEEFGFSARINRPSLPGKGVIQHEWLLQSGIRSVYSRRGEVKTIK